MSPIQEVLQIDRQSSQPVYEQIVAQVIAGVRAGKLTTGVSLPPQRDLADLLQVNRNTLVKAFRLLQERGYLASHVGRGTVVAEPGEVLFGQSSALFAGNKPAWPSKFSDLARRMVHSPRRSGRRRDDTIYLSIMEPSDDLLPSEQLQECFANLHKINKVELLGYAPPAGISRLRHIVTKELQGMGMEVQSEEVLITSGSSQALDIVVRALVNPGDKVLIEEPTYHGGIELFKMAGATLLPLSSDDQGPLFENVPFRDLEQCKLSYLIPNFRNPTGSVIGAQRRQEIANWVKQTGQVLVEDDYAFEFGFDMQLPRPLKSYAPDHTIYINSFSKRLAPALRVGYVVVPKGELLEKVQVMKKLVDLGNSALLQHLLCEFIEQGFYKDHLKTVMTAYQQRRQVMKQALDEYMPQEVKWDTPKGGLFFWLALPPTMDVDELVLMCRQRGVKISGGKPWSVTGANIPYLRLLFCSENSQRLVQGVRIVSEVIKSMLVEQSSAMPAQESLV